MPDFMDKLHQIQFQS